MDNLYKNKFRIDSTRLKRWDYASAGYYFVTICVKDRECVFGSVDRGKMILSEIGSITEKCWIEIPCHFPFVRLGEHVIMPNHVHGIIVINEHENGSAPNVETQYAETQGVETPNMVETQDFASLPTGFNCARF